MFRDRQAPDEVAEHRFTLDAGRAFLPRVLTEAGLAPSRSEAERLLRQGAVSLDGVRVEPGALELRAAAGEVRLLRVGKRRFARIRFE